MARKSSKTPRLDSRGKADTGPLRETGDVDMDLPFHALEQAPWNPKPKIHGIYRRGLMTGLDYFGLRDRLKVWMIPGQIGRYYVLDGNQRIDTLEEMLQDKLFNEILDDVVDPLVQELAAQKVAEAKEDATEEDLAVSEKEINKLRKAEADKLYDDKEVTARISESVREQMIPCRVLVDLDTDDAKLFTATFDRNRAKFDEAKQADLAAVIAESKQRSREMLDKIMRPEKVFVAPPPMIAPPTLPVAVSSPVAAPPPSGEPSEPTEDEPWGKPPADAVPVAEATADIPKVVSPQSVQALIPCIFSFTPDGYREVKEGILKTTARIIRQQRVIDALKNVGSDTLEDVEVESAIVEIALRVYQARADVAASGANMLRSSDPSRDDV